MPKLVKVQYFVMITPVTKGKMTAAQRKRASQLASTVADVFDTELAARKHAVKVLRANPGQKLRVYVTKSIFGFRRRTARIRKLATG
jgi:hypothetical protein